MTIIERYLKELDLEPSIAKEVKSINIDVEYGGQYSEPIDVFLYKSDCDFIHIAQEEDIKPGTCMRIYHKEKLCNGTYFIRYHFTSKKRYDKGTYIIDKILYTSKGKKQIQYFLMAFIVEKKNIRIGLPDLRGMAEIIHEDTYPY